MLGLIAYKRGSPVNDQHVAGDVSSLVREKEADGAANVPASALTIEHGSSAPRPTEPIEGRTPVSRQRLPNAIDVYWADSIDRRNTIFVGQRVRSKN